MSKIEDIERILLKDLCLGDEDGFKEAVDAISRLVTEAKIEGRIEAGVEMRKSMISTSPFIEKVLNPYITEQRRLLKLQSTLKEEKL